MPASSAVLALLSVITHHRFNALNRPMVGLSLVLRRLPSSSTGLDQWKLGCADVFKNLIDLASVKINELSRKKNHGCKPVEAMIEDCFHESINPQAVADSLFLVAALSANYQLGPACAAVRNHSSS